MADTTLPPLRRAEEIMREAIAEGTRAAVLTRPVKTGLRTSLEVAFADLGWRKSPILSISPQGLRRFRYETRFGRFAGSTVRRMNAADEESKALASALVNVAAENGPDEAVAFDVTPVTPAFSIAGTTASSPDDPDGRLVEISRDLIAPIMSAFAELNGYDVIDMPGEDAGMEGAITLAIIRKRERNPRNRMLALRIHGSACKACDTDLAARYGLTSPIVDIHHLQPLASCYEARAYDPATDLVPLCPNCHRIAHSRRPVPYDLKELKRILATSASGSAS